MLFSIDSYRKLRTLTYHKAFKISGRSRGEWNRPTMKRRLSSRQTRQSRNWGPAPRSQKPFRAVIAVVVPTTGQPTASSRRPSAIPVGKQDTLHLSAGQSPCSPGKNVRSPTKLRRPITFRMISNHLTMQPVATVSSSAQGGEAFIRPHFRAYAVQW